MSAPQPLVTPASAVSGHAWNWSGPYTLQAVRDAGTGARAFLSGHGVEEPELAAWELLISEAGNNSVLHCGQSLLDKTWQVHFLISQDRITARIHDLTAGFEWPDTPHLPPDDAESGRGLFLIFALTDYRKYARYDGGNTLTLERRYASPGMCLPATAHDLDATLDGMTEELAACYESLSAIFRFTAESRQTSSVPEFARKLLGHLVTVTRAECGMLRMVSNGELITAAATGCGEPEACLIAHSPMPLEAAAVATRQDQWIDVTTAAGHGPGQPLAGLVHPFYHEDELMGLISLGRHSTFEPLNAGEVNIVHTFAEFFCQQLLSRRHEEDAIRSSLARREFELAAAIQKSLLPSALPDIGGISVTGHCESALTIGGDFYDIIPWENRGFVFVIADVMGKGVAASMMAAVTRSVIRSLQQLYQTPGRALDRAARQLFDDLDRLEMFVTVSVGIVDSCRKTIRIANAGHCPVVVVDGEGHTIQVTPDQPPVGLTRNPECMETEIPLTPGTRILAYTDGLTDPRNSRPCFDDPDQIAAWFSQAAATGDSAAALQASLLQRLAYTTDGEASPALADDQTFLIMAYDGPPTPE